MLVQLGLVEERYQAVCEVLAGVPVTEVAVHFPGGWEHKAIRFRGCCS